MSRYRAPLSIAVMAGLTALLVATSGDPAGQDEWDPRGEGYRHELDQRFEVSPSGEPFEAKLEGVGQHWGNDDEFGAFRWKVWVDVDEGAGAGSLVLWDCEELTSAVELGWEDVLPSGDDEIQLIVPAAGGGCGHSSICRSTACLSIVGESGADEALTGSVRVTVGGEEGVEWAAWLRQVDAE